MALWRNAALGVPMKRRGFTLVELLVVISIISILAAIIWPVFTAARQKARQSSCMSNLRQIGMAALMYANDSDDTFPLGGDPEDINTNIWEYTDNGQFWQEARDMPPLWSLLMPYTASHDIWRCPSDNGITATTLFMQNLPPNRSSYLTYGSSYYYHTELALRHLNIDNVAAYPDGVNGPIDGGSNIPMIFDGSGTWHGAISPVLQRYDVVFCDGHVQTMTAADFFARINGEPLVPDT
jgi:prepilin-type N-terminal cleavage/methylation domain-containing protein/prepilin-type processing-associated H-X9-DG protein